VGLRVIPDFLEKKKNLLTLPDSKHDSSAGKPLVTTPTENILASTLWKIAIKRTEKCICMTVVSYVLK